MFKVLVVEDDLSLANHLRVNLETDGYAVRLATTMAAARSEVASGVDAIILDLCLPDGHGFKLLDEVHAQNAAIPVVILTALTESDVAVEAFERGASDYVRKPFSYRELLVRLKASLREPLFHRHQIRFGELTVFPQNRSVRFGMITIDLLRREYDVFIMLLERAETVVSRRQILERLDVEGEIFDRTVDVHVSNIRTALKTAGVTKIKIVSIYGIGYRLNHT